MAAIKQLVDGKWRYVHEDGTLGMPCSAPTPQELQDAVLAAKRQKYLEEAGERVPELHYVEPPKPKPGTRKYKVLTQRDEWFMGKFSPEKLEEAVNHYASQGWRVVGVATADVGAWWGSFGGGMRQEIVVFMEWVFE